MDDDEKQEAGDEEAEVGAGIVEEPVARAGLSTGSALLQKKKDEERQRRAVEDKQEDGKDDEHYGADEAGDEEALKTLLEACSTGDSVSMLKCPVLILAASHGHEGVARVLVEAGGT